MARLKFSYEKDSSGIVLRLSERRLLGRVETLPPTAWAERASDQSFSGLARVLALADEPGSQVEIRRGGMFLDHATVASLSEPQALSLDLPPSVRFVLQIDTKNLITDQNFQISSRWIDEANRSVRTARQSAIVSVGQDEYRLPEPLFGLLEAIDAFTLASTADDDVRIASLARLQAAIPQDAQRQISIDGYLSSFRVMHATAFSLNLKIEGRSFDFDPILFGRRVSERSRTADDITEPVSEAESLLTEYQQDVFAKDRFRASAVVKASYVIESGIYVHLDPSLREAMTVVRRMQGADAEMRKRFAQAPQLYLKEQLSRALSETEVELLFIETEQYSARVLDVGVWAPPVIPWIKKEPSDWLPEKFGLQIGGEFVVLNAEQIEPLREQIREARAKGEPFVEFGEEHVRIPATPSSEESLSQLLGAVRPTPGKDPPKAVSRNPRKNLRVKRTF